MNIQASHFTLGLIAALSFVIGCDKKPDSQANDTTKAISDTTSGAAATAGKAVGDAKAAVEKVAADASNTATTLIAQATSLVKEGKYTDALSSLQKLTGMTLTPDQEKLVANLKEQIQKAMAGATGAATDAAGAAGNLIKK